METVEVVPQITHYQQFARKLYNSLANEFSTKLSLESS